MQRDKADLNLHNGLNMLELLQLADSALPIGATAHSLGLEMLVEDGLLTMATLNAFFADYIAESGRFEAIYCRVAYALTAQEGFAEPWLDLNRRLDAIKTARESRTASATLGRRFLQLVSDLEPMTVFALALRTAKEANVGVHHCTAFGLVCGQFGFALDLSLLAYLQQSIASLISACQRLMPLGQSQAAAVLWQLKPRMVEAVNQSDISPDEADLFIPTVEIASMRHPLLATRLFIS